MSAVFPVTLRLGFTRAELTALMVTCAREGVSDLTIQSGDYIWARHSRTYVPVTDRRLETAEVVLIIGMLYGNTAHAELLAGVPLDFRYEAAIDRDHVKAFRGNAVRAQAAGSSDGIQITLRSIPEAPPTLDDLGIEQGIRDNLFPRYGLVLVVGTTGSGKSTLLAASNRWRLERRRDDPVKIITFEDPIEYTYTGLADGVMPEPAQTEIGIGRHLSTFERAGPNAMRRAPDVIVMGEMRDATSVDAGLEMAMTGHATYATLHVDTPAEAIDRLISFYPHAAQAAVANKLLSTLRLVIAQKLARTRNGKVIAFRAWVFFDRELRERLAAISFDQWAPLVREHTRAQGTDFLERVREAWKQGLISEQVACDVAGLSLAEARVELGAAEHAPIEEVA